MVKRIAVIFVIAFGFLAIPHMQAQQHRATRLGNPATRFSNPLRTADDLRYMLLSEIIRADVEYIARESGFQGDMADLRRAASTSDIQPLKIPVGTRLPAMSTRKDGKAILLRDVLWAGSEPIDAYEFFFTSKGRRYRVVSPKACANFWVEDAGSEPLPVLVLSCEAPNQLLLRRQAQVCFTVLNTGDGVEPAATITLPIPAGATFESATAEGKVVDGKVVWVLQNLAPGASNQVCAVFNPTQPGMLTYASTAQGTRALQVQSRCETHIMGIAAVLLEVVDLHDPIELGEDQTYEITVLNQGSAPLTNMKLACTIEEAQQFVSGTGPTPVQAQDRTIAFESLPLLNPKETSTWRVTVKALTRGDVRFTTGVTSDEFQTPVEEVEATQQY